jgi:hypothetical protein
MSPVRPGEAPTDVDASRLVRFTRAYRVHLDDDDVDSLLTWVPRLYYEPARNAYTPRIH